MEPSDFEPFALALRRTFLACSAGQKEPDPDTIGMYFDLFDSVPLPVMFRCLKAHAMDPERGRFAPRPADITFQLQSLDGHPSADEAWAIAVKASDERNTVVWTGPMAEAWGVASALYERTPSQAAAAFKDAYAKLVAAQRSSGLPATWITSLGHDQAGRQGVIAQAASAGKLPSLGNEERLLLEAPKLTPNPPEKYREKWNALLAAIKSRVSTAPETPADLARTAQLKAEARAKYDSARGAGS